MFYFRCIFYTFYINTGKPMNRNIILKTFDEVRYFNKRLLFAVELKEKVTFLILSNEPIFDIETLRNYLIENELNQFAKNEIINLIGLIDNFLKLKIKYEAVPKSENHFSYEYQNKGKGVGGGNLMYILKVNDSFLKVNEATFSEKEPLYSRFTSLNCFKISNRLLDIKDLFANFLEQPQQPETYIPDSFNITKSNKMENINLKDFFDNIENHTGFERKKILSNLTNNFDLNLLTELSNSFVQHCFYKFNQINYSLPKVEMIEKKEGDIWLNDFHFPFYEFVQNEVQKEVRTEIFNNISFNDCIRFNSFMNTFLDEIETIIENQNIKINGMTLKPEAHQQTEAVKPDEVKIIKNLKENIFDDVEPNKVYQHFRQLIDNKYITTENFNYFLVCVFEKNEILQTKIEIIRPNSKTRVRKIFYKYFETYVQSKYGMQKKYIDLLCNNFTGFNANTLSTNFAK